MHAINSETRTYKGKRGVALLHDPLLNKGTAFTQEERDALGLRGLLPPHVATQEQQLVRVLENFRSKDTPLEQYIYLIALQERNESLFYRLVMENLEELQPIIYTPTVGLACQKYDRIFRRPQGVYIGRRDRGHIEEILRNWPCEDIRMIVVTDGERILGLGDLGSNGMGIPVGKLSLYTACAGIPPSQCLPISIDAGTNNLELLKDPLYLGTAEPRMRGAEYDELIDEFVGAVQTVFPMACVQFEDFGNANAFRLLARYRDQVCSFNDDIQGTAGVTLAGLISSTRISGTPLEKQRFLFLGAGEAGIGIGDLIVEALKRKGVSEAAARAQCWFFDSKGLVVRSRTDLAAHKRPYAHEHMQLTSLHGAVEMLEPTALIGVSGMPHTFTEPVVRAMARLNERPVVFALSNPTSKSECTAEQCYEWTEGRGIFASGSPFAPVTLNGVTHVPGQGNNSYIFPGVGLGVLASASSRVTDEMFYTAASVLAGLVKESDLAIGRVYPDLKRIREVSLEIGTAVAEIAFKRGLARVGRPEDIHTHVALMMFDPRYESYV